MSCVNSFRLRQGGHHFVNDILKFISLNKKLSILNKNFAEVYSQVRNLDTLRINNYVDVLKSSFLVSIYTV